ncbi:DEAD/DEAH box helicase [Halorhabdus salina]|uniref:DEAD/DEAH box helicase n=1 Tax=Halorhabdus salina TaxID=2750670 RepID=UPI0015EEDBA4|nr:helicase-related protein [Halorhabdus salina]
MTDCDCGFEIDDRVSFAGGEGEVLKITHHDSGACLLQIGTDEGKVEKRPSTMVEKLDTGSDLLAKGDFDAPEHFDLRLKAEELSLAHRQDRFVALEGSRIDIEPYQVQAAHEILSSYDHRYLIGDEVGLGKTIEAAIVIEELVARGRAERVLIVTPAPLTVQWQQEMQEKFDRDYIIYDRDYVDAKRQASPNQNVWKQDDRIITSIDFAKQDDMLAALKNLDEEWDVAVFDESHHLTARRRNDNAIEKTDRYRAGDAVATNSDGLIFLTGTPHKGKTDQFYFMVSLLDPYRFRDEYDITPDKLDDLMIRRLKEDMYEEDGTPMFPEKNIKTLPVNFTEEETQLYDDVTEYISEYYNLASRADNDAAGFAMVIYQKRLVSSIHAIRKSLKSRMESIQAGGVDPDELSSLVKNLLPQYREDPDMLTDAQRERVEEELEGLAVSNDPEKIKQEYEIVQDLYQQAKRIDVDSKAEELRDFVEGILEKDPEEKILVFTEYTDTLEYLRDRVFSNRDVAEVYGDLSQERRRRELKKFENEANIMLATDAAREGLNLQFAHIMVNYDLPWNPTRIDQRMGRLHRYGQENTVEIRNLFVDDTRESDILQLLMEKLDEIENTLGMSSDVLGLVLDDVDLEDQIMSAIADDSEADVVADQIDRTIEEKEEALRRIENEFLIRDHFDLENEDQEILDIIEASREETVSEDDVEFLVWTFCSEYGGRIVNVRRGPAEDGGDVFDLVVPDVINGGDVQNRYDGATFDRKNAIEDDNFEFIALDHPVVQSMMQFCMDTERAGGQTAIKTGGRDMNTPGLLCNFRIGYLSGTGETVTERMVQVYVPVDGSPTTEQIDITGSLPPSRATEYNSIERVIQQSESLLGEAETKAWQMVEDLAEDAREDRQREVGIKREHAKRYFESRIEEVKERLERFEARDQEPDSDMRAAIGQEQRRLEDLRQEREEELARLDEDEQVVPEEPDLVNMAVVIDAFRD